VPTVLPRQASLIDRVTGVRVHGRTAWISCVHLFGGPYCDVLRECYRPLSVPDASFSPTARPGSDEVRLVGAAQQGDRAAFGELYARYARMVHGILLARVPQADVDDLVQDVFLQAMERLSTLRDAMAFGGWLASIARHRAIDFLRRAPRTTELPEDLAVHDPDRMDALAVLSIIQTLPDAYRETLVLRLVEGFTGPEIAAYTGLTEGSVRVNLHRGMRQLRDKLAATASPLGQGSQRDGSRE
jgi:RNA polymerase sigma-70 factor, ECF subfamily